ncbi:MAG: carnitine dehydratase [Haliea sp.]|uniref:CaiB/BaiF CoA transferase family protein n=1 Tax=Haliea sp. TaxID=1932666 RepID=UPI000C5FEDE3|nr:CaiB/BaiF CoA-transferase family protein [Haliea sp.]MBM70156.1 carnitine dehydratase [Haliea sp.]|tara:strand:- start:45960 stop:47093 length:1134 start_codon:yes stop_codon:yes gene_type:complete
MGPLNGFTVIELAGIGPAPMGGMMLADMGAEVIRIERANAADLKQLKDVSARGKKSVVLNLKQAEGVETLLRMVENADVVIDPYRPGVCEKLGIGPDACMARNPRLVFARMTGWGQDGPLARAAGHDINYISLTGALFATGRRNEKPVPPLNLVGDMGGGGMLLVNGVLAALLEAANSGKGQVIDVAMVDGAAQLMWMFHGFEAVGAWDASQREANLLDGAAHFYDTYECADGRYISLGSIEPQFYALLMQLAELPEADFANQHDAARWPEMTEKLAAIIKQKTQAEWCELMEGTDVCFAPVLSFTEAPSHPANVARNTYIEVDGVTQPAPAPRFSRTPSSVAHGPRALGEDTAATLAAMGFAESEIRALRDAGTIG